MKQIIPDIEGVIFDLGSTLIEYENIPWDRLNVKCLNAGFDFLKKNGFDLPSKKEFWNEQQKIRIKYREQSIETLEEWSLFEALNELLTDFNLNGGPKLTEDFFRAFYGPVSKQLTIFPDTHKVLETIQKSGRKIGLVSNTFFPEEYHYQDLVRFDLKKYFDFLIFSITFGYKKPHQAIYKKAVELLNIQPDRLLFVGDRYIEDVRGPLDYGLKTILKYWDGRDYPDPMPENVIVVNSLEEILPYIIE